MSAHKPRPLTPLRDRRLTNNSPKGKNNDPVKSSILRESGLGWGASPPTSSSNANSSTPAAMTASTTSPLRIAKRGPVSPQRTQQHPSQIARRSSSTYKRLNSTNLVSNSPFKSQIPTPTSAPAPPSKPTPNTMAFPSSISTTARKVSGEKRPRPLSMHDQAESENDRPFAYKRERKQSKGYQGLIVKEPVTKSPFKLTSTSAGGAVPNGGKSADSPLPPLPAMSTLLPKIQYPKEREGSPSAAAPPPGRSCLVSKRLHGPRLSGGKDGGRRRQGGVIFNEQCDVFEFDPETEEEEEEDDVFLGDGGDGVFGYGRGDDDMDVDESEAMEDMLVDEDDGHHQPYHAHEQPGPEQAEDSFESVPLSADADGEADDSITGMVNSMLHQANANTRISPHTTITPPRHHQRGNDEEDTEDGVPYGRTHHFERVLNQRSTRSPPPSAAQEYPFRAGAGKETPSPPPPMTPPKSTSLSRSHNRVTSPSPLSHSHSPSTANMTTTTATRVPDPLSPGSHIPLGRTTHSERVRAERKVEEEIERGVQGLEGSPSPVKGKKEGASAGLVPKFGVRVMGMGMAKRGQEDEQGDDPFVIPIANGNHPTSQQPHRVSLSFASSYNNDASISDDSMEMDPANLSFSGLEMELGLGLGLGEDKQKQKAEVEAIGVDDRQPGTPESDSSYTSLSTAQEESPSSGGEREDNTVLVPPEPEPAVQPSRVRDSPGAATTQATSALKREGETSLGSLGSSGSLGGRTPRISREDVQRRLMRKRSVDSPVPEERTVMDTEENGRGRGQEREQEEEDGKRMSVMTDFDLSSTEAGTIETVVEKRNVAMSITAQPMALSLSFDHAEREGGGDGLKFDLGQFGMGGSGVGKGTSIGFGEVDVDMRSALDRLMDDVAGSAGRGSSGPVFGRQEGKGMMKVETVTEGIKAGQFEIDESMRSETEEDEGTRDRDHVMPTGLGRPPLGRAATEPDLFTSTGASRTASGSTIPPPPPPKDAIRSREELILEKRREARRREEDESLGYYTPPRPSDRAFRRRSRSTGDMEELARLDVSGLEGQEDEDLSDSIQRELRKLGGGRSTYHIKEKATIYASSDTHRISHMESAGDVNAGKAWRPVRRPSDMNEYSKQIKEFRAQEKPGKAHGKVFVRVVGIEGISVPLPQEATAVTCTLNNGIHFVTTPECRFGRDSRIDQEFELIEHSKLEFTLTLKIRRDPHIITMFKAIVPTPTPPPPPPTAPASKGGMRAFFSSPKKTSKPAPKPASPAPLPENLARYLKPDGTLARAFISFKDIATRCDTKLFETSYPLIGQRMEIGGVISTLQVGELVLQVFRLPPLPGIPPDQLPQSLEECHRGLRHINWHKMTYFEGTLTQQGGDCTTWRRRQLRVIGANLVAFNDVTKKATATIGLKKAIAVEDDQPDVLTPASGATARSNRYVDEYDGLGGVERSFRLIFPNDEEIMFFADTDEEKAKWLEVLRALVGHIPPNPLWAELIWQRQDELKKQAAASQSSRPIVPARNAQDESSRSQQI